MRPTIVLSLVGWYLMAPPPFPSRLRKNEEFSSRSDIVEQEAVVGGGAVMRGMDHQQSGMFSYISAERRVPKDHPLRAIRAMVDAALKDSSWRFDAVYASSGRPSIAPEKLLRALLLQVLYTVRSERLLMEQLDYNFLFRWL